MENTAQINLKAEPLPWSAIIIEKMHRCSDCPIRKQAMRHPKSIFAKLHSWHKNWWPGWKAHQARACAFAAGMSTDD